MRNAPSAAVSTQYAAVRLESSISGVRGWKKLTDEEEEAAVGEAERGQKDELLDLVEGVVGVGGVGALEDEREEDDEEEGEGLEEVVVGEKGRENDEDYFPDHDHDLPVEAFGAVALEQKPEKLLRFFQMKLLFLRIQHNKLNQRNEHNPDKNRRNPIHKDPVPVPPILTRHIHIS